MDEKDVLKVKEDAAVHNPAISVVMPVYNGEKYLVEAIESILNQTFRNFEFIIVCAKSQDSSLEIIKKYMWVDDRIKLIQVDHKGIVYSLNIGVDMAKGKYIARMDADDISLPERFEVQYAHMEENPDIIILGTFVECFGECHDSNLSYEAYFNKVITEESIYLDVVNRCPLVHPTVMMKSTFAKQERYDSKYSTMEDYDLWVRAVKKGYILMNISKILLRYRVHKKSKSYLEQGEEFLKAKIEYKLNHFYDVHKNNVLVWGAGLGGRVCVDYLQSSKWNEKIKVLAVVDKEKEGEINNIKIIKPNDIDRIKYDYVFITTNLGRKEVSNYLDQMGLNEIEDYVYII